jgi:hypothetical protein
MEPLLLLLTNLRRDGTSREAQEVEVGMWMKMEMRPLLVGLVQEDMRTPVQEGGLGEIIQQTGSLQRELGHVEGKSL